MAGRLVEVLLVNNLSEGSDHARGGAASFHTQVFLILGILVAGVVLVQVVGFHKKVAVQVIRDSEQVVVAADHRLRTVVFLLLLDLGARLKNNSLLRIPLLLAFQR